MLTRKAVTTAVNNAVAAVFSATLQRSVIELKRWREQLFPGVRAAGSLLLVRRPDHQQYVPAVAVKLGRRDKDREIGIDGESGDSRSRFYRLRGRASGNALNEFRRLRIRRVKRVPREMPRTSILILVEQAFAGIHFHLAESREVGTCLAEKAFGGRAIGGRGCCHS
jgi:hypothetical protein